MDRLDAMRVFTHVVEQRSFTQAALALRLPRSTVTDAVKQLEARLGVSLLRRTTRTVHPTLDGEAYHQRALAILADVEDAEAGFAGGSPRGLLRVDVHGKLARHFLFPGLPAFLATYPQIELVLGEGDRAVDLVREGIDCALRVGELKDSDLVSRRVALLDEVTLASPAYVARHGAPRSVDDLGGHRMIAFHSSLTGGPLPLEFVVDGAVVTRVLPAPLSVNGADSYLAAARLGLGLIQIPRYNIEEDLRRGDLVVVLPSCPPTPTPASLLYPKHRQLSPRVRVFIDWLVAAFATAGQKAT